MTFVLRLDVKGVSFRVEKGVQVRRLHSEGVNAPPELRLADGYRIYPNPG